MKVKTLKKLLKKAGLKTSGKKTALTRRAKKAKLLKGGLFEFLKGKPKPTDPTAFSASNPMFKPTNTPKQAKWEGSPEQITARAERLKDPNIAGTADHFFEQGKRNPKYLNDDDDGVNPIKKYLELYGTNLYDQKDDLVKDYIHHFYMHVAVSR